MAKVCRRRNRYVLDYYDHLNERQIKTLPRGTTLPQAKTKMREIEDQLVRGNYIPTEKIPKFREVAADWIERKRFDLRASTWSCYEGHTRNHFQEFNHLRIDRITTAMIEKYILKRRSEGMPIASVRKILVSLGQIFAYASRHGYIHKNPYLDAQRPKATKEEKRESIQILKPHEINALLDAIPDQKYYTLVKLSIFSGMRQGEALGFK